MARLADGGEAVMNGRSRRARITYRKGFEGLGGVGGWLEKVRKGVLGVNECTR